VRCQKHQERPDAASDISIAEPFSIHAAKATPENPPIATAAIAARTRNAFPDPENLVIRDI
jgi:hypothetical protein